MVEAEPLADVERAARPDSLLRRRRDVLPGRRRRTAAAGRRCPATDCWSNRCRAPGRHWPRRSEVGAGHQLRRRARLRPARSRARRASPARHQPTPTRPTDDGADVTRCYDGAVVRYPDDGRTVTVVGTADFMTNAGLLQGGQRRAGDEPGGQPRPRVIWYAPTARRGRIRRVSVDHRSHPGPGRLDRAAAVPRRAARRAVAGPPRSDPLVAEDLPVVVRASETVEGRGRLYRSRRARDRAADALRTAHAAAPAAAARPRTPARARRRRAGRRRPHRRRPEHRSGTGCSARHRAPTPTWSTSPDQLDDIERQVAHS